MSYGGYPPPGGQGYPPQQPGYPGSNQPGYPPAAGGYGAAPGGYGAAPGGYGAPQSGYPPQPQGGGYPPSAGGYGGAPSLGYDRVPYIGFEGVAAQQSQPPAQNYSYGMPPQAGGYGSYPPAPGAAPSGYPPQQPYGQGYPAAPPGQPAAQGYPPQQGYPSQAPAQGYPSAPMPSQQHGYSQAQPQYGQPPHQGYPGGHSPHAGKKMAGVTGAMAAMKIATHGTVKPASGFNAESDAQVLRKAMKGLGTDEKAIINVIGYRSNGQRQELKTTYKQSFGRDLVKDLKSELGGNFEDLAVALMMKPREYDAYCLKNAMAGAGTTETTLIEILSTRSNAEIKEIRELYKKLYHKDLEKELMSETSGHFRKFLVSLANASRDESGMVDQAKAAQDAEALYRAGEKKMGTDEATFNRVMASRNFAQLRATFEHYHKIAKRDIIKSLQGEFSGDIEDAMCAIVDIARDAPAYFAKRLYRSMKGAGTNDSMLIRVMVTRSEIDMVEIKDRFQGLFKQPLGKFIGDDTSGDYKKLLQAIVGH